MKATKIKMVEVIFKDGCKQFMISKTFMERMYNNDLFKDSVFTYRYLKEIKIKSLTKWVVSDNIVNVSKLNFEEEL